MRIKALLPGVALSLLAVLTLPAQAAYPDRPIHFVVPFAPSGNTDVVARVVAQGMASELKESIVVDNRAGANTLIGATFVARSRADGYTFLQATAESMAINPQLYKKVPYDVFKDFSAVGIIGNFPFALVVSPNLPVTNLREFIAYARQNPGKLNYASWGIGSTSQIAFEQLKQLTGIDMVHVPFSGAAPAMTAVTAGNVQAFLVPLTLAASQAKGGLVKLLAVTSDQRQGAAAEVPTFKELGYPIVIGGWHVLVVPKGTPDAAIDALNKALNVAIANQRIRRSLLEQGIAPIGGTPADAQQMLKSEYGHWGAIARAAHISVDHP